MLTPDEIAHAQSILEPATLAPIPPVARPRILVASVVRKPPQIVAAFLQTLAWQRFREPKPELAYHFIANFAPSDPFAKESVTLLRAFSGATADETTAPVGDYADGPVTREWTKASFERLASLKNHLLQRTLDGRFDAVWLLDADVLCDPFTLQTLLDGQAPITSAVYWTNWQRALPDTTEFVHAGPQVWLRHPYQMSDARYSEAEFRQALIERQRIRVGGLGACTLIAAPVIQAGISFASLGDLMPGPMSEGEDRHFCERARRFHIPLHADAWSDIWHAYHPAEYDQLAPRLAALYNWPHVERPSFGDLVSARIEQLEPIPDGFGRQHMLPPALLRGKFGALAALPQIEEQIGQLAVGESAVLRVHYPAHYELACVRGLNRLFRVTLLDCKAFRYAPVIESELFAAGASRRFLDATTLTPHQVGLMIDTSRTA